MAFAITETAVRITPKSLSRFAEIRRDPADSGANSYLYADGRPSAAVDPAGLWTKDPYVGSKRYAWIKIDRPATWFNDGTRNLKFYQEVCNPKPGNAFKNDCREQVGAAIAKAKEHIREFIQKYAVCACACFVMNHSGHHKFGGLWRRHIQINCTGLVHGNRRSGPVSDFGVVREPYGPSGEEKEGQETNEHPIIF